jgi:hypothetical protein
MGEAVIDALSDLGVNVIVKLHDRSRSTTARGSGGIDWIARLSRFAARGVRIVPDADVSPYLFIADLLVTDHSSVGFEYMLLDRPIVILDSPELVERAKINQQKVDLLRSAARVAHSAAEAVSLVREELSRPAPLGAARRNIASTLFYRAGTATARAERAVYDLLGLPVPEPAVSAVAYTSTAFTTPARNP